MENVKANDTTPNTTSCVSASPDVRSESPVNSSQAPAEAQQPTKAAKKRAEKAKKGAYKAIVKGTEGIESIRLSGDAAKLAKETDNEAAERVVVAERNADAAFVAEKFERFTGLCEAEDEARNARRVFVETVFRDAAFRKRLQNVRDFFAVHHNKPRALREAKGLYLTGKDGVTKHFTAPNWFRKECGVTYEYVRRLLNNGGKDVRFSTVMPLLTEGTPTPQPPQPRTRQPRVSPSDSPSGKVNVNELPEETRKKVLAAINGTETTIDIPPAEGEIPQESETVVADPQPPLAEEMSPFAATVDEKVRWVVSYANRFVGSISRPLMSVDEKEEFYRQLSDKFRTQVQFPIEVTVQAPQAEIEATA